MANSCIKTGARVYFGDYGLVISADLYKVGNCYIVKTAPDQVEERDTPEIKQKDFDMEIRSFSQAMEFWRVDIGVFVVQESQCWFNPSTLGLKYGELDRTKVTLAKPGRDDVAVTGEPT